MAFFFSYHFPEIINGDEFCCNKCNRFEDNSEQKLMKAELKIVLTCLFFVFLLFTGCGKQQDGKTLFSLQENTGIEFVNTIQNSPDFNIFSYRNFYNGGGVAIGDINNDGLADIFFTANMGANKLYLNKGSWQFDDISVKAGFVDKKDWSTGVVFC